MTDRELLELAAKAAALDVREYSDKFGIGLPLCVWWNPLNNDGDALRLAVKLRINLIYQQEYMGGPVLEFVEAKTPHTATSFQKSFEECLTETDEMAATRRAIVRAAAEIGKSATV